MLDAVNDILALVAMTVLDPPRLRTICLDFMDNPFHGYPDEDKFRRMEAHGTEPRGVIGTVLLIARGKPLTLAVEPVDGEDSKVDAGEHALARVEADQILMDRDAFIGEPIGVLRETAPPVFPVITREDLLWEKLGATASHMTEETICEDKEYE